MLEGKTVAVVADQDSEGRANDVIAPALEEAGATLGSTAVLTITGEDTSQAQAQMDAFLEQWEGEGVDTIFMAGLTVSAKQFVQKIKGAMPDVQLIFDDDSTAQQAQDLASEGVSPNPYDGSLSTRGRTDTESWENKTPLLPTVHRHLRGGDRRDGARSRRTPARRERQEAAGLHRGRRLLRRARDVQEPSPRRSARS